MAKGKNQGGNHNPTGKGGFQDHPELRNNDGAPRRGESVSEIIRVLAEDPMSATTVIDGKEVTVEVKRKVAYVMALFEEALVKRKPWAFRLIAYYHDGLPRTQGEVEPASIADLVDALEEADRNAEANDAAAIKFLEIAKPNGDGSGNGNGE
jgi:hypothetical protein